MEKENKRNLSSEELEDIAGGGVKGQLTAGLLGISALVSPINATTTESRASASSPSFAQGTVISQKQEDISVIKYLTQAHISGAQEKAFKITNDFAKENPDHREISYYLSSERYYSGEEKTPLEALLDEEVKNGDLPIPNFTISDMKDAKDNVISNGEKNVEFVYFGSKNAINLHQSEYCRDGDIVNLASQFNALESMSNVPTSVKFWYADNTQGPYCALQSVAATKHRESAHLQGKLVDGMKEALENCKIDGKPITEKYPDLYKGGYLEMMEITDEKDMEQFLAFLENEENLVKHMKVLMQWVKCEGTEKKQLQFFTAAPSFQGRGPVWQSNSKIMDLRRKACVKLVDLQYRAMAQAAAIIAAETGKNVRLHVTMVGHGVFNNPTETVSAALNALNEELQGVDATVFLHNRPGYSNIWEKGNPEKLGINILSLNDWKKQNLK